MNVPILVTLVLSGGAALITSIIVFTRRAAAGRRAAFEAVAQQSGWNFSSETVEADSLGAGPFPLFTHGRGRKARNVIRLPGRAPAVTAFDYQYTVGGGEHQHTVVQSVVHVSSPRLSLPPFVLGPENFFHRIGELFGYHDIDFESSPGFSKQYLLRSKESETLVRDLFTPSVRAYFEQRAPITVEGRDDGVLVYRAGRQVKPEDLTTFVADARAIAQQFER